MTYNENISVLVPYENKVQEINSEGEYGQLNTEVQQHNELYTHNDQQIIVMKAYVGSQPNLDGNMVLYQSPGREVIEIPIATYKKTSPINTLHNLVSHQTSNEKKKVVQQQQSPVDDKEEESSQKGRC